ncbi:hypothetical protein NO932_11560 [Pelagibacterium sp. 26DY04]|uniref:hypothetical protein n=1 Tax=Pelagibacterium sp. 26DY04 TaxID=2967130 RepID=UPI002815109E|nr:hypothetical protein [Pelagibacterium sp. 26DY04]WMT85564.1 hypothetical protein NO932_11560 [Pelagibacterium sp. 26DY04]
MAGTGAGRKYYISDGPVGDENLDRAAFEALTWVRIGRIGTATGGGASTNFPTYGLLDEDVANKQKGLTTPADMTIELRPKPDDLGQIQLADASQTRQSWGFKIEEDDAPDDNTTNSIQYNRGAVGVPTDGFGGSDDFRTKTYTVGLQQIPVDVPNEAIVP